MSFASITRSRTSSVWTNRSNSIRQISTSQMAVWARYMRRPCLHSRTISIICMKSIKLARRLVHDSRNTRVSLTACKLMESPRSAILDKRLHRTISYFTDSWRSHYKQFKLRWTVKEADKLSKWWNSRQNLNRIITTCTFSSIRINMRPYSNSLITSQSTQHCSRTKAIVVVSSNQLYIQQRADQESATQLTAHLLLHR